MIDYSPDEVLELIKQLPNAKYLRNRKNLLLNQIAYILKSKDA